MLRAMNTTGGNFDYDWLVIGSGFGGSVSALRLAEKGYRVGVLEAGRRYRDEDYAKTTWDLQALPLGAGARPARHLPPDPVQGRLHRERRGGRRRQRRVRQHALPGQPGVLHESAVARLDDWAAYARAALRDRRAHARRAAEVPRESDGQQLLREVGRHFGVEDTFTRTPVGVYFGEPGRPVPDPYFGGEGPERTGCTFCGACMVGCRDGAKNTLLKNYLWFAEKRGARILPSARSSTSARSARTMAATATT